VDPRAFLDELTADPAVEPSLVHVRVLPARDPAPEPIPDIPELLADRLGLLGITGLYPHQRAALEVLDRGDNVVMATGTASGKTLVYNLAFAKAALHDRRATALYLFPTKALARDQLRQIRELKLPQVRAAVYDGDTPQAERPLIRRNANLVMTNPDMLHASILAGHARWADFLLRLSLVVVDEAHVARGVFGSHVAMVLRRLRRMIAHYGGDPRFCLASATIGNPSELAERLTGLEFEAVVDDASPRGERLFALWNPPLIDEDLGLRRSVIGETSFLLERLVDREIRTIAFARTRRGAEVIADITRKALPQVMKSRVKAYRAGYLPEERREIERALSSGDLLAVAATNALELGIDVGALDAALLAGYPGTRASMWQQAGRAGRRGEGALAVLIAQDDPLDQYLVHHPEDLFDRPAEAAVVDPTNPYVAKPHLMAAAREQPLDRDELVFFGDTAGPFAEELLAEGRLVERRGRLHHRGRESAHAAIDIRSASGALFAIVDEDTGALIGTVDEARAFASVHPGAIYLHQGEQYEVGRLDMQGKVALVRSSRADWYTRVRDTIDIDVLGTIEETALGSVRASFGDVRVTTQVIGFQRISTITQDPIDLVGLDLPAQTLVTRALWWAIPDAVLDAAEVKPADVPGAAHAAEHAAIGLLPLVATCDRWDVGGVSTALHEDVGSCAIFIYDGYPGGAGIAERGHRSGTRLLEATLTAVRECPCRDGCPACVQSPKCGNGNEPLDKAGAIRLLAAMLGHEQSRVA
jgi:DEAD/DEAH box helicase domain-containing protein